MKTWHSAGGLRQAFLLLNAMTGRQQTLQRNLLDRLARWRYRSRQPDLCSENETVPSFSRILRELTPPLLYRAGKRAFKPASRTPGDPDRAAKRVPKPTSHTAVQPGSERGALFYDETFEKAAHWKSHYTKSRYYPLWTVIADRLKARGATKILDIGCGPGQVACLMRDTPSVQSYLGIDFSEKRISQARKVCSEFDFAQVDVFKTDLIETADYDSVLVMEFLEHINEDLAVLGRLRSGVHVLATVPNFSAPQHVRYFDTIKSVKSRYESCLSSIRVDEVLGNDRGSKFFIVEGQVAG